MLPRRVLQQLPVLLEGAGVELVSPLLRLLECPAAGIDERGEGRVVDVQLVLPAHRVPERPGRACAVDGRLGGLFRESGHVENVETDTSVGERRRQRLLDGRVVVSLAHGEPDDLVVGIGGELHGVLAETVLQGLEELLVAGLEYLEGHVVLDALAAGLVGQALDVVGSALARVAYDEDRRVQIALDGGHVLDQLLGAPEGGLVPAQDALVGRVGSSALGAVVAAPADGEHRCERELVPSQPGQRALDVPVPQGALDHGAVIEHAPVQIVGDVGDLVDVYPAVGILPCKVGYVLEVPAVLQDLHELDVGELGGIPAHDHVDVRPLDEILVEV